MLSSKGGVLRRGLIGCGEILDTLSGALLSGIVIDIFGLVWAVVTLGALTFASGVIVALRMRETVIPHGQT
ncbi:MAG TPA: hypothetical protein VFH31_11950 [Pyrinomonadaceae bacterium]|nr:hypothetical protein [Pyrinomonadaceae bacterium]